MITAKSVDEYIISHPQWKEGLIVLREIIKTTELQETVKWGTPTYTLNNKNVVGLGAFKSYFGIWFFQGAFLKDFKNKLINAQEGKTKGLRQWRFTSMEELDQDIIFAYVQEAIENQKAGKEIKAEKKALIIPPELEASFQQNSLLAESFKQLTPGKQKEYAEYILEAKREATKESRIQKITRMIIEGIGLNDKYK